MTYSHLTDGELSLLNSFFAEMKGSYGEFIYLDPGGNLVPYSDDFAHGSWEKYNGATPGAAVGDPFGGSRARAVTGGANAMLAASVLPAGNGSGITLCGSVYVWAASTPQQLSIGFIDSGFSVLASTTWDLRAGWQRIQQQITLSTNSSIRMLIGGFGTWASANLQLFGAQCVPLAGPGVYVPSPANFGLHAKCRFDSEALNARYVGPNQNSVSFAIAEYA
jgi:hypothetical protein